MEGNPLDFIKRHSCSNPPTPPAPFADHATNETAPGKRSESLHPTNPVVLPKPTGAPQAANGMLAVIENLGVFVTAW